LITSSSWNQSIPFLFYNYASSVSCKLLFLDPDYFLILIILCTAQAQAFAINGPLGGLAFASSSAFAG
jgi:hypothetical protein